MSEINRVSRLPLYHQLYQLLHDDILSGRRKPGDLLPAESELMEKHRLSRTTVRQGLDRLVNEGLITRQRGKGSFVAHPTVEQTLVRIVSFTDDMRQRGLTPSTRVISTALLPAPPDIARRLAIEEGQEIASIERLRLADGEPMSVEKAFLVHRLCPRILEGDYALVPLREALAHNHSIRLERARQVIRAILATHDLAHLLSIEPGSALLFLERVSYSQDNIPTEFLRIYYRADRYSLVGELQG